MQRRNAKHGGITLLSTHRGWPRHMLPLIIPCVCPFSIVFIAGASWFRSVPSGDSLKGWVPHLPLVCVISPLSAHWPLFKEDGKWDSRASLSLRFFSPLSDTSCCFTVYDAGWEALREGDVWSLQRCKKSSHFPWWYVKIPRVASRASFLSLPPPPQLPSTFGSPWNRGEWKRR